MLKARSVNMPRDNVERAIKKGTGELGGEKWEEVRYEGYGPGGAAVIVDATSDNRHRTGAEVRHVFSRFGGNMGATGLRRVHVSSASVCSSSTRRLDADQLMESGIEANAKDIVEDADTLTVQTAPEDFAAVKEALEAKSFTAAGKLAWFRARTVNSRAKNAEQMLKLYEALDELEDVSGSSPTSRCRTRTCKACRCLAAPGRRARHRSSFAALTARVALRGSAFTSPES